MTEDERDAIFDRFGEAIDAVALAQSKLTPKPDRVDELAKRTAELERQVAALAKTVDELRERQAHPGFFS